MSSTDWVAICSQHMRDPAYKERCKKAKQNRLTEKDGSITKHTGGSISFAEHKRRMAESGRVVSQVELHKRTDRRDEGKGEYVNNKSKRVYEQYEQYEECLSQHGSNLTPDNFFDAKKWLEIAGGPCKGKAYNYGNTYHYRDLIPCGTSSDSMEATSTHTSQAQVEDIIFKAREELAKEKENFAKEREEQRARLASILEEALQARDEAKRIIEQTKAREEAIQKTYELMLAKFSHLDGAPSQSK